MIDVDSGGSLLGSIALGEDVPILVVTSQNIEHFETDIFKLVGRSFKLVSEFTQLATSIAKPIDFD